MTIGLSARAANAFPALMRRLYDAGIACAPVSPAARGGDRAFLHADEAAHARAGDILVERDPAPMLERLAGAPVTLRFDAADEEFGLALACALARPDHRPACAAPDSAAILTLAERIASSDATVLVLGETGTGKEGIARYVHACSPRAGGPFVAVNCAALPDQMLEAILFGHRKGAFTGAAEAGEGLFRAAQGGTLLLDEVAEIPLGLQAKLLRALQEREVLPVGAVRPEPIDVRVVACANRDLSAEVAAGRFRADLYWRLNVVPVGLRPLAERPRDIPAIAAALLLRHQDRADRIAFPTAQAVERLIAHDWPGNVRELDNVLQRALLLGQGARIEAADLIIDRPAAAAAQRAALLGDVARSAEAQAIRSALARVGGHRGRAAETLGISERTLRYRLADMRAAAA